MKYLDFAHYLVSKFRFGLFNVFFFIPKKSDGIKQSMEDNDKRYFILNILGVVNLFYNCLHIVISGEGSTNQLVTPLKKSPDLSVSYVLHINKVTVECRETLQVGLTRALQHLMLYSNMFGVTESSVEMEELITFFHSCETQFVRGNAEKIARAASEGFAWKEEDLDRDGLDLVRLGSISTLASG